MRLTASLERYLEAVFRLEARNRVARVSDISRELGVTMASVVSALRKLDGTGLVVYRKQSFITMTDEGRQLAEDIETRSRTVQNFLEKVLKLSVEKARSQAGPMGAGLDEETVQRLLSLTENAKTGE